MIEVEGLEKLYGDFPAVRGLSFQVQPGEVLGLVGPNGATRHLERDAFTVEVTDRWTSPATHADYPAGWTITIPGADHFFRDQAAEDVADKIKAFLAEK